MNLRPYRDAPRTLKGLLIPVGLNGSLSLLYEPEPGKLEYLLQLWPRCPWDPRNDSQGWGTNPWWGIGTPLS